MRPTDLICRTDCGIYCPPGDFYIDPVKPVDRALVTHGHSDHARAGHGAVLATSETLAIMAARYGEGFAGATQAAPLGETIRLKDAEVRFVPAGHVLGSAQIVLEAGGTRLVVSGDYKRAPDPTCLPYEVVPCDVFITEATFGLPVFHHPDAGSEVGKLLDPLADRIFIVALAVALVSREVLPLSLAIAVIARDVLVLSLFPALESRGIERIRVNFIGKTATACLLIGLTLLAWSETVFPLSADSAPLGMALTLVGGVLYWVAGALYAREAVRKIHALRTSRIIE